MLFCNIWYRHETCYDSLLCRQSFWPNGYKAEPRLPRDEATRMRTRVAAKVALLSSLSGECQIELITSQHNVLFSRVRGLGIIFTVFLVLGLCKCFTYFGLHCFSEYFYR
jgi:hypothetical protein